MDLDPLVFNVSYRQAIRRILEREQGALSVQSAVELSRIAKGLELWEEQARLPLSASTEVEAKLDDLIRRSEVWLRKTGQTISEAPLSDIRQKFARLAEALALASNVTVADGAVARERTEIARAGAAIEQAARTMSRIPTAGSETRPSRVNADSTELHVLSRLEILARQRTGNDSLKIESVEPFYTQSSKDVFLVRTNAAGGWPQEAILRISPVFSIVETNLADEYGMLQIVHCAGLRVPRPLLGEGDPDRLGGQFVMMERVDGHVIRALDDPECAIGILKESARFLAQLHRIDPMLLFTARNQPHAPLRQLVEHRISDLRKRWDRDRLGSSSIIAAAFIWLFDHVQQLSEDPVLVHGDFDLRN
ncbi:MAG: phosphotransferase, partial [Steroidobacteraceae bacterium]